MDIVVITGGAALRGLERNGTDTMMTRPLQQRACQCGLSDAGVGPDDEESLWCVRHGLGEAASESQWELEGRKGFPQGVNELLDLF